MAFHWDRANRLLEQTQRRVYGSAARVLRRGGGGIKIFRWGVSPSKKAQGTAIHVFSYTSVYSNQRHLLLPPASPLPPVRQTIQYYVQHLHERQTNEPYTPWEICDEPLIPHSTRTAWTYYAVFCSPLYLNPPSYILVLLAAHHRGFVHPYEWLSTLIGYRR